MDNTTAISGKIVNVEKVWGGMVMLMWKARGESSERSLSWEGTASCEAYAIASTGD